MTFIIKTNMLSMKYFCKLSIVSSAMLYTIALDILRAWSRYQSQSIDIGDRSRRSTLHRGLHSECKLSELFSKLSNRVQRGVITGIQYPPREPDHHYKFLNYAFLHHNIHPRLPPPWAIPLSPEPKACTLPI